jgi:hypothetical protein
VDKRRNPLNPFTIVLRTDISTRDLLSRKYDGYKVPEAWVEVYITCMDVEEEFIFSKKQLIYLAT